MRQTMEQLYGFTLRTRTPVQVWDIIRLVAMAAYTRGHLRGRQEMLEAFDVSVHAAQQAFNRGHWYRYQR